MNPVIIFSKKRRPKYVPNCLVHWWG